MQSDNYNIDNFIRNKTDEAAADDSRMDEHWQQMQQILKPAAVAPANNATGFFNKNFKALIFAATIIGIALFFWVTKTNFNNEGKKSNTNSSIPTSVISAQPESPKNETALKTDSGIQPSLLAVKTNLFDEFVPNQQPLVLRFIPCDTKDTLVSNNLSDSVKLAYQEMEKKEMNRVALQNFYTSISKSAQVFNINNRRDTLLICNEGTVLYIPAYSFMQTDSLSVVVKEFYKYSDMVMNNLTTMTDNNPLISGGMLHIVVKNHGEEISLMPDKFIKAFIPGISQKDSMQLFYGQPAIKGSSTNNIVNNNSINWQLTNMSIDSPILKMFIRAIDLKDNSESRLFRGGTKVKAVFYRSPESELSKEELLEALKNKYGKYYDKIVVRNKWKKNLFFQKYNEIEPEYGDIVENSLGVGDTAELLPGTIRIYNLKPIDTVYEIVNWVHLGTKQVRMPLLNQSILSKIGEKYSVQLDKLNWINCDRLAKQSGRKVNFTVQLNDNDIYFNPLLVFEKYKSVLPGYVSSGNVIFSNVPAGENVTVICTGINSKGEIVSTMQKGVTGSAVFIMPSFEETNSTDFKKKIAVLDLQ